MPSRTLPTFTRAEVEEHKTAESCYVTLGANVYDVSDFVEVHPGGADLVLQYAGKDVADILKDEASHWHSEAAYEILDDSLIGFLISEKATNGKAVTAVDGDGDARTSATEIAEKSTNGAWVHPRTGMSKEEDLTVDTDITSDYKTHKFLDLNRPLFPQVWFGGFTKEFYLDQVHRPRHYKGGASAPLFGNFLEPLTMTPWWVIPIIWWPFISYGVYEAGKGLQTSSLVVLFTIGLLLWTFVEYVLHRFLFHIDYYLPDNRIGITLHFTLHGIHHYLPMDRYRLVMPPTLFAALAYPFWIAAHAICPWSWYITTAVFSGVIMGYTIYDMTHYFLHHQNLPLWYKEIKKYHLQHHFLDYQHGFGVSNRFWDTVFGTEIVVPTVVQKK